MDSAMEAVFGAASAAVLPAHIRDRKADSLPLERSGKAKATILKRTMTPDRIEAIIALLGRTEEAHGAYERAELDGVYDEDWPRWYATYAVDNGIGAMWDARSARTTWRNS